MIQDGLTALLVVLALAALVWALVGDRSRGRRRCPACWYDMALVPGCVCPECGTTARYERAFRRTRRRWRAAAAAAIVLSLIYGYSAYPRIQRSGWPGAVPTPLLLILWPCLPAPTEQDLLARADGASLSIGRRLALELADSRARTRAAGPMQRRLLYWMVLRGEPRTPEARAVWRSDHRLYAPLIAEDPAATWSQRSKLVAWYADELFRVRKVWPAGMQVPVRVRQLQPLHDADKDRWLRITSAKTIPGPPHGIRSDLHGETDPEASPAASWEEWIGPLVEGAHTIAIVVELVEGTSSKNPRVILDTEVRLPVTVRPAADALPSHPLEHAQLLIRGQPLRLYLPLGAVESLWDRGTLALLGVVGPITCGVRLELLRNGEVVATGESWISVNGDTVQSEHTDAHPMVDRRHHLRWSTPVPSDPSVWSDTWMLRVTSDPAVGVRSWVPHPLWQGSVDVRVTPTLRGH